MRLNEGDGSHFLPLVCRRFVDEKEGFCWEVVDEKEGFVFL